MKDKDYAPSSKEEAGTNMTLGRWFKNHYHQGNLFDVPGFNECEMAGTGIYHHVNTGVKLWTEAMILSNSKDAIVLFHYKNEPAFLTIKPQEANTEGYAASPDEFGSVEIIIDNNFRRMFQRDCKD